MHEQLHPQTIKRCQRISRRLLLREAFGMIEPTLRKALAIGADDAIRVNAEPVDSFFVASQIAEQAKGAGYDLILMGRESIDYNSGVVHSLVGALLNMPSVSPVMKLDIEGTTAKVAREIEGGKEYLEIKLPFLARIQSEL